MSDFRRYACIWVMGLSSGAFALSRIQVEKVDVGERTLVVTVDDSILPPDLSKIRVEGYEIETAVFVEELGQDSTKFAPGFLDLTAPGRGKVVEFIPTPGILVLDLPYSTLPSSGTVIADTSFGGIMRKVVEADGPPQSKGPLRRWVLKTVEAELTDAVLDCDLVFKTRVDMNQALANVRQSQELQGSSGSLPVQGLIDISMKDAQVLFQPVVSGRIKIRNGVVELFRFSVAGDCEVIAGMSAEVHGKGEFEYEEELPGKAPTLVFLGSGLFVKLRNRPFLALEATSHGESISAKADFRIRNSIKGELSFGEGNWRPMAENKMTWIDKPLQEVSGNGHLKISLKPRIEMLLQGVQGPIFTFEPFVRFASAPLLRPTSVSAPASASGSIPASGIGTGGEPNSGTAELPIGSGAYESGSDIVAINKEMSLGANIFMEARTTFGGPSSIRNFLLFKREQTVLSPPREGNLSIKGADSNHILLLCQTYPKSEHYIIQQKLDEGPWQTVVEKAAVARIPLGSLKPGGQYRFRAIGVNSLGRSPAFPMDGVAFTAPMLKRPPFFSGVRFPDSGAVLADSIVTLTWKGGDPDPADRLRYSVLLDTHNPPMSVMASGIADSFLTLSGLPRGETYYWKVIASDGLERTESPVSSFTMMAPRPVAGQQPKGTVPPYPLVLMPEGTYSREDGGVVRVGAFYLGKYEVTQSQFEKVTGTNPSYRVQDSLPVDRVTWEEAESYCRETGGRLPTEAEWEYAARAGAASSFYWSGDNPGDYAWYRDNSDNRTQKVGLKKPNPWGLFDMAGNVFEWVQDWYAEYDRENLDNPKGPRNGVAKVIRGASWYSEPASLSLMARYNNRPGFRNFKIGFRCAMDPERAAFNGRDPVLAEKSAGAQGARDDSPVE